MCVVHVCVGVCVWVRKSCGLASSRLQGVHASLALPSPRLDELQLPAPLDLKALELRQAAGEGGGAEGQQ